MEAACAAVAHIVVAVHIAEAHVVEAHIAEAALAVAEVAEAEDNFNDNLNNRIYETEQTFYSLCNDVVNVVWIASTNLI